MFLYMKVSILFILADIIALYSGHRFYFNLVFKISFLYLNICFISFDKNLWPLPSV